MKRIDMLQQQHGLDGFDGFIGGLLLRWENPWRSAITRCNIVILLTVGLLNPDYPQWWFNLVSKMNIPFNFYLLILLYLQSLTSIVVFIPPSLNASSPLPSTTHESRPQPFHFLQDVLKAISAKQRWDLGNIRVSKLDVRKEKFGRAQMIEFQIHIGKNDLIFGFPDEVGSWKELSEGGYDFGSLINEVSISMAVLNTFKVEGPMELWVSGDDELSIILPAKAKKVVVVGGGYIGMEVAAAAAGWKLDTTIIYPEKHLLPRLFTPSLTQIYEELYQENGIKLLKGTSIKNLEAGSDGHVAAIKLENGSTIEVDTIIIGIGANPATGPFESVGLNSTVGGIQVDGLFRSSVPGIFAVGDVTSFPLKAVFRRYLCPEKDYLSFSLIYNNGERSLDLICKDKTEAEVWLAGLKALISSGLNRRTKSDIFEQLLGSKYQELVSSGSEYNIAYTQSCNEVYPKSSGKLERMGCFSKAWEKRQRVGREIFEEHFLAQAE